MNKHSVNNSQNIYFFKGIFLIALSCAFPLKPNNSILLREYGMQILKKEVRLKSSLVL